MQTNLGSVFSLLTVLTQNEVTNTSLKRFVIKSLNHQHSIQSMFDFCTSVFKSLTTVTSAVYMQKALFETAVGMCEFNIFISYFFHHTMFRHKNTVMTDCILSPNTLAPHCLVEASVNADIRSSHLLHGKLADLLDGSGSPSLETPATRRCHLVHRNNQL